MKHQDSGSTHLNRRQLLLSGGALFGGLALAGGLTGCGGAAQAAADDIRFWHLLSGGDGIKMMAMIDKVDRKSTRQNSSHRSISRMPSSA